MFASRPGVLHLASQGETLGAGRAELKPMFLIKDNSTGIHAISFSTLSNDRLLGAIRATRGLSPTQADGVA